jgi:hypothetical protein
MAKYRTKSRIIEAITFDEFIEYGKTHGANIENGMPWSFKYNGYSVTHENDECYLITRPGRTYRFTPDNILLSGEKGEIYPCTIGYFNEIFEPIN